MSSSMTPIQPPDLVSNPAPQAPFVAKLLIVLFALSYMLMAMYLIVDCWVLDQSVLRQVLRFPASKELPAVFLSAVFAVLGAILGAGVLDIVSFHHYASVKRDFQASHVWGYFVGPFLAAGLGLMVFALVQTGLLVFSPGATDQGKRDVANLGYLVVGFFAGYGWMEATQNIRAQVRRFFASPAASSAVDKSRGQSVPVPPIQAAPAGTQATTSVAVEKAGSAEASLEERNVRNE